MNPSIFREYDIRGAAGVDFDDAFAHDLGRALASRLRRFPAEWEGARAPGTPTPGGARVERASLRAGRPIVAIGRDCRLTSEGYAAALAAGFNACGVDVVDVGICPTPLLYFALHALDVDGGVQVTASHNPPEDNGFKLCRGAISIHGAEIASLREEIEGGDFVGAEPGLGASSGGRAAVVHCHPIGPAYRAFCAAQFGRLPRRLRVVVDAGNAVAGPFAPEILEDLGCEVIRLHCEPDGRFPNHHPDPTVPENLVDLSRVVAESRADLGIAYDGDADRVGVIAPSGRILWGDELLVIFAREILSRRPGATIVSEVKCSQRLYDDVAARGGRAVMWKAGHSLIKAKMRETGAVVAGEMSGHMFFADRFLGHDDAIYASCRLLEILAHSSGGVEDLVADLPPAFSTPEIRVDCPDRLKFEVVRRARDAFAAIYPVEDVDGVRVRFADGWGLVRASNTGPVLVLRFEASTAAERDRYRALVEGEVARIREQVGDRLA